MRKIVWLVLAVVMLPGTARAQQPPAVQSEALQRLVNEQARRLEALEARLAALQTEVKELRGLSGAAPARPPAVAAGAQPVPEDEEEQPVDHPTTGQAKPDVDQHGPASDLPSAGPIDAYGSLRIASAVNTDGTGEIRNNGSRLGLRGEKLFGGEFTAFARVEVGVNLVNNDRAILETGDPGNAIGQGNQAFTSRLGFLGLGTPYGNVSWGKQWSAYYDVAEFTDQFQIFSGSAAGAYPAGTDGGIAGTGRAERAFQYRESKGLFSVALQAQSRNTSPNDRGWADTWGASVIVGNHEGFSVGAGYNEVRDGVENPNPNQSQLGDKAAVFGARYRYAGWYGAVTFALTEQHEVDDLGRRFDGKGWELAFIRDFTDRLWLEVGFNNLEPDSDHPGDYRVRFGVSNIIYRFGEASRFFGGVKIEGSRTSAGEKRPKTVFAGGLRYNF
jgi:outer membrane protein N